MSPTRRHENQCMREGYRVIAGLDEVGMGCLAGPVVAAAVILNLENVPKGVDDSKKVSPKERSRLSTIIRASAVAYGIGTAEVEEIDSLNIYHAAKLAMCRALEAMPATPEILLIDGKGKIPHELPQICLVKGDQLSVSIAAASIVAKVYRDEMMTGFDMLYPGYDFASHKGYGSRSHRVFLQEKGPCPLHRKSFSWTPV